MPIVLNWWRARLAGRRLSIGVLVVLVAGLVPVFWVEPGQVAKSEDFMMPIDFAEWLRFFSTWDPQVSFGSSPDDRLPALFFMFWPAFFRLLGFSIEHAQRLQFAVWFAAGGFAMYILMRCLTRSELARVGATLLYLFNFYQEPIWQGLNIANLSAYVAMPLLLAVTIRVLRGGSVVRHAAVFALVTVIGSGIAANPPMVLVALIPVPTYLLLFIGARFIQGDQRGIRRALKFGGLALALTVCVNAYWLLPQAVGLISAGPTQTFLGRTKEAALPQLEQLSSFTSPFNTLRIRGHWVWYEAFNGVPYLPHAPRLMAAPEAIAAATIPIIAAVGGMLAIRDRRFWAFAVLMLIGIFIGSGVNGPTGRLFGWVWEYVPGFWTLRSPWYKGTALLVLGMAPLAGLGLAALVDLIRPRAERWIRKVARVQVPGQLMTGLLAILLIIPYLGYTSSFMRGQFFVQRGPESPLPGFQVRLPDHLDEAREWLSTQSRDDRILALPPTLRLTTDWGYTGYMPPLAELSDRSFINLVEPSAMPIAVYDALLGRGYGSASGVLARSGIGYVMQQEDVNRRFFAVDGLEADELSMLMQRHGLRFAARFGPLVFFAVQSPVPHVTATRTVVAAPAGLELLKSLSSLVQSQDAAIVLTQRVPGEDVWSFIDRISGNPGEFGRVTATPSRNIELIAVSGTLDAILDREFLAEPIVVEAAGASFPIAVSQPGIYEIWQRMRPVEGPTLTPAGKLLLKIQRQDLSEIDWGRATINGALLDTETDPGPLAISNWEARTWTLAATFVAQTGAYQLELPRADGRQPVELVAVHRQSRVEAQRDAAQMLTSQATSTSWHLFSQVQPDDIVQTDTDSMPTVELWHGWVPATLDDEVNGIRRITTAQKSIRNLKVTNPQDVQQTVALVFTVESIEIPRSLWVNIDNRFVATYTLPANHPQTLVVEDIELDPGENFVTFYSPDRESERSDGGYESFRFNVPFVMGTATRDRKFSIAEAGAYDISVLVPPGESSSDVARVGLQSLSIDGQEFVDKLERPFKPDQRCCGATVVCTGGLVCPLSQEAMIPIVRTTVRLDAGLHDLRIVEASGRVHPVMISPWQDPESVNLEAPNLTFERLRDTHFRVTADSGGPYILVLNELYDARWRASVDGQASKHHVEVNGFANGFLIEADGEHVVEIVFAPQSLADVSGVGSTIVIVGLVAGLALSGVRRRRFR